MHLPARVHLESAEVDRRLLERQLIDRLSSIPAVDAVAKTTALHWAATARSGSQIVALLRRIVSFQPRVNAPAAPLPTLEPRSRGVKYYTL